jgi:hypothetical protein
MIEADITTGTNEPAPLRERAAFTGTEPLRALADGVRFRRLQLESIADGIAAKIQAIDPRLPAHVRAHDAAKARAEYLDIAAGHATSFERAATELRGQARHYTRGAIVRRLELADLARANAVREYVQRAAVSELFELAQDAYDRGDFLLGETVRAAAAARLEEADDAELLHEIGRYVDAIELPHAEERRLLEQAAADAHAARQALARIEDRPVPLTAEEFEAMPYDEAQRALGAGEIADIIEPTL